MLKEKLAAQFDFLKAKTPPLVGCDISSSSVKMVEISEAGRNVYRGSLLRLENLEKVYEGALKKPGELHAHR